MGVKPGYRIPPGATILLPSACISHSNITVGQTETRYPFTQYTAGSLFQWVDHGFRLNPGFWSSLDSDELADEQEKRRIRLKSGLSLRTLS